MRSREPSRIAAAQDVVARIAQRRLARRERADVVADGDGVRLDREPRQRPQPPFGEDVVEQDGIDAPEHQIAVRVHVVVVRDRLDAVVALGPQQNLVRDRAAQRGDLAAAQIGERAEARHVRGPDAQDFAELVVGNRQRQRGAARQRVFDAAQADVRVAPGDGLVDRRERDLDELRRAPEAAREQARDLDVEADLTGPGARGRPRQTARRPRSRRPSGTPAACAAAARARQAEQQDEARPSGDERPAILTRSSDQN